MYEIIKSDENKRTVLFTEDAQRIQKQFKDIRKQISKDLEMPGFRPGKVPRSIVDKRYGNIIKAEVAENVRSNLTSELLETEDWILGDGDTEGQMDLPAEGKPYSFEITFSLFETPQPKGVDGIKISLPELDMDSAVEDSLNSFRERLVHFEPVERPSEKGDLILLETSVADGNEKVQEFSVRIGESQIGPGFDELVTGLIKGVEFSARMDGGPGEDTPPVHSFRVIDIKQPVLPELNDDFASRSAGLDTMEELREKVEKSVRTRYEQEITYLKERTAVDSLLESNEFTPPSYMVDNLTKDYLDRLGEEEPSEEAKNAAREMASRKVREFLILRQVALKENIEISDSEIEAESSGDESRFSVLDRLRNVKSMELILDRAAISEKKPGKEKTVETPAEEDTGGWRWIRIDGNVTEIPDEDIRREEKS